MTMLAGAGGAMGPGGAAGYAPPFGHVPGMVPPQRGPLNHGATKGGGGHANPPGMQAMQPGMQGGMQPGMQANMRPGMQPGMQGGMQGGMQANMQPGMQANPYAVPSAMPMQPPMAYGAAAGMQGMGAMQAAPYGNGAQYGAGGVPPPTPVVTTNGRLGRGLSPDSRELRWKLFIGQVPHEVCNVKGMPSELLLFTRSTLFSDRVCLLVDNGVDHAQHGNAQHAQHGNAQHAQHGNAQHAQYGMHIIHNMGKCNNAQHGKMQ